ncbi:LysR family transcriptional regulator [Pelagibius sp.]|uniref:LysR family transcriptional regulator n=1 Tax=Pelagibius sp. TaxID=1931238 RepID=UPI00262947D0|nr:LysR family transcriptional regulator [Pelagibius sp.]
MNWNDLRYVLAVGRAGRLAAAARQLGVDATTVTRRLTALQAALGQRLYQRQLDGRLELTEAGRSLCAVAERMERDLAEIGPGDVGVDEVTGVVRLTSVPYITNRVLIPEVPKLAGRHAGLGLELIAESRDLSLTRREADMALRFARPRGGGMQVKTRLVGRLDFAAYTAAEQSNDAARSQPWITYDETMAHLPQARWLEAAIRKEGSKAAPLRVNDVETAHEAVAGGCGRSLLPSLVAARDRRLRKLPFPRGMKGPQREVWLLVHAELAVLPRIKAVAAWVEAVFARS